MPRKKKGNRKERVVAAASGGFAGFVSGLAAASLSAPIEVKLLTAIILSISISASSFFALKKIVLRK